MVITWESLDAVASYRLSENNSRYGTTTHILPPFKVLHGQLMGFDPAKIKEAMTSKEPPFVVILPKDFTDGTKPKRILSDAGLWYL